MTRKIIHVDMDCFYAAVEMRDDSSLMNKPIAVGGAVNTRSVLCTCNYIARQFGVKSAMTTAYALKLCPDLIILPVKMDKYKEAAKLIHKIFLDYTPLVEPLSLDEAYIDVTENKVCRGSATLMAKEIREKIWHTVQLTASAGIAPNKFLAKVASGWRKPNAQFTISPKDISSFIKDLSVKKIYGVGEVTAKKLLDLGIHTCSDLQQISQLELGRIFGKFGLQLYDRCRGIDHRLVEPNRIRKSLSVETTLSQDILRLDAYEVLEKLYVRLQLRLNQLNSYLKIKNIFLKIKFSDFNQISVERSYNTINLDLYKRLFLQAQFDKNCKIRLVGIGIHFMGKIQEAFIQENLF